MQHIKLAKRLSVSLLQRRKLSVEMSGMLKRHHGKVRVTLCAWLLVFMMYARCGRKECWMFIFNRVGMLIPDTHTHTAPNHSWYLLLSVLRPLKLLLLPGAAIVLPWANGIWVREIPSLPIDQSSELKIALCGRVLVGDHKSKAWFNHGWMTHRYAIKKIKPSRCF